jgi:hypothetical protein
MIVSGTETETFTWGGLLVSAAGAGAGTATLLVSGEGTVTAMGTTGTTETERAVVTTLVLTHLVDSVQGMSTVTVISVTTGAGGSSEVTGAGTMPTAGAVGAVICVPVGLEKTKVLVE